MGWRNSKSIELSSSDDPTQVADWVTGASREWHITLLPAWGYDPIQPGKPKGSQRGVRTAF